MITVTIEKIPNFSRFLKSEYMCAMEQPRSQQ